VASTGIKTVTWRVSEALGGRILLATCLGTTRYANRSNGEAPVDPEGLRSRERTLKA
jgi:hypothetical protein